MALGLQRLGRAGARLRPLRVRAGRQRHVVTLPRLQAIDEYEEWSDEQILEDVTGMLRRMFPEGYEQPVAHVITRWKKVGAGERGRGQQAGRRVACKPCAPAAAAGPCGSYMLWRIPFLCAQPEPSAECGSQQPFRAALPRRTPLPAVPTAMCLWAGAG